MAGQNTHLIHVCVCVCGPFPHKMPKTNRIHLCMKLRLNRVSPHEYVLWRQQKIPLGHKSKTYLSGKVAAVILVQISHFGRICFNMSIWLTLTGGTTERVQPT